MKNKFFKRGVLSFRTKSEVRIWLRQTGQNIPVTAKGMVIVMEWICVTVKTVSDAIDDLCDILHSVGVSGLEIDDEAAFNEFLEANTKYWDYVDEELLNSKKGKANVKVYLPENDSGRDTLIEIKGILNRLKAEKGDTFGSLELTLDNMNEEDWANNWKKYYKPIEIGEKLIVTPIWEEVSDTDKKVLKLDPGMTFGTGLHHSTQLALMSLEKRIKEGDVFLDLGCGSGILAIAGILFGAKTAKGIDIDENAARVTLENAALNEILPPVITSHFGDIISDENLKNNIAKEKYDIITANIVADVIIALCDIVEDFAKSNAIFITSGIIDTRKDDVLLKMGQSGFEILEVAEKGGWCSITAKISCKTNLNKKD